VALAARVLAWAAERVWLAAVVRVRRAVVFLRAVLAAGFEAALRVVLRVLGREAVERVEVLLAVLLVVVSAIWLSAPLGLTKDISSKWLAQAYPSNMCL
jgi:hypothetical protein